jgi:hypothetical protein
MLCDQAMETMHHLMISCPFSKQIWQEILAWLRLPCTPPHDESSHFDWWTAATRQTPKPMPWMLWKLRNDSVFERAQPLPLPLIAKIKDEASAWVLVGAKGLGVLLPTTWDVH